MYKHEKVLENHLYLMLKLLLNLILQYSIRIFKLLKNAAQELL